MVVIYRQTTDMQRIAVDKETDFTAYMYIYEVYGIAAEWTDRQTYRQTERQMENERLMSYEK